MRKILILVFSVFSLSVYAESQGISDEQYTLLTSSSAIDRLHRLKINEIKSVESSLADELMYNAIALGRALREGNTENEEQIWRQLALIAVMGEKLKISVWESNDELKSILKMAKKYDPAYTNSLRSKNWSKPMWSASDEGT